MRVSPLYPLLVFALACDSPDVEARRADAAPRALAPGGTREQPARREVALTFDDLPGGQTCAPDAVEAMNRKLVGTIATHRIPAVGLVVGGRLCERHRSALPALLAIWLDAGLELGNHSFSHFDLNDTPLARYQADVIRGDSAIRDLMERRGLKPKYFRHPFLHAGRTLHTQQAFERFLVERGYRIAPVTVDNQEWVFAEVYAKAKHRGDEAMTRRVGESYVAYMDEVFAFFEKWSVEVAGYEVRQVVLLHANQLNADYLDELILMMQRRGYAFISLDRALEDPAYRSTDTYVGPRGLSWLHRWALSKGMPMREEPREPEFIADAYRN